MPQEGLSFSRVACDISGRLGPQREIKRVLAIGLRSALTALIAVRPFPAIGATRSAYQAIGLRLFALDQ
jgi:hypothetical protein